MKKSKDAILEKSVGYCGGWVEGDEWKLPGVAGKVLSPNTGGSEKVVY